MMNNEWNVEFIDDSVVLKKETDKRIYMLNDEHKTPFKMYFLGTIDIDNAIDLRLKYNEYVYLEDDNNYNPRTLLYSINNYCKINVLMKKLNNQIPQTFTNEELNKIDLKQLNDYPIYYNYITNLINKQKSKIDESKQLMEELKKYIIMNPKMEKIFLEFDLESKGYNKLLPIHKHELNDYINKPRKIKTITIKKNEDITDFLQNPPTRDLQNNIKLFEYFFNKKPNNYEIQLLNVHEPHFNIRKQIKKYQFKTYSRIPGGFIGDIFFNKSKFACLLLININTRKAYSYALNNVEIKPKVRIPKEAKPIGQNDYGSQAKGPDSKGSQVYTITYSTTNKKTTSNLINVFRQFLNDINHKITSLRFDNESAVKSKQFQTMLRNNGITFVSVVEGSHTSLSLIDRLCRTIRDISYNTGIKILNQDSINKILNIYNNMYHSSLSKILGKKITPNEVNEHPELEQQIINYCIDYNKQLKVLHPEIELQVGQICKVYQPFDKFKKRRRLLKKDYFRIVNKTGNIYTVQNVRNNKKIDVPRYFIYDI